MRRRAWVGAGAGTWAMENWATQKKTNAVVAAARNPVLSKNDFMPPNIIGLFECFRKVRCGHASLPGAKKIAARQDGRGRPSLHFGHTRAHLSRVVQAGGDAVHGGADRIVESWD